MSKGPRDPLALKFKGSNKAFSPFATLSEGESVTRLWKVVTRVSHVLEEGERVSNLAWRLWHLHSQTVIDDSPRHRREFKKLSKAVGEKLDRDKGKTVDELGSPDVPAFDSLESAGRLASRVQQKSRTRRPPKPDGSAASMMHTFELDPTVGVPKTSRSGSSTSVGSSGMRPTFSSDHSSAGSGSAPLPTASGRDVDMAFDPRSNPSSSSSTNSTLAGPSSGQPPAPALQRASSIPSALRMTPNSSRRSSFARQPEDENLPPPYPSNHPFARQHSGQIAPLQTITQPVSQPMSQDSYNAQLLSQLQAAAGPSQQHAAQQQQFHSQQQQQQAQGFLPNMAQQQQQQQQQQMDQGRDPQQVVTATLNQLWSQLGCGTGGQQNVDMLSPSFINLEGPPSQGTQVGSTPASSDVSSPDLAFSPAASSGAGATVPAQFHFAQRVPGLQTQPGSGSSAGSSTAQAGPYRRPSNSDAMTSGGASFRRPSQSQQSSAVQSGAGSPAATAASPFPGRSRLNSIESSNGSRRGSFVKRRRESMNHSVSGGNASTEQLGASLSVNTAWSPAGTPTGDLSTGLLGVEIASPLEDNAARLTRLSGAPSTSPQTQQLKHRSFSSSSQNRASLQFTPANNTPQMKALNAAHLSALSQSQAQAQQAPPNPLLQWQDPSIMTSTSSSVFFEDAPMEDASRLEQQQKRRSSDSNVVHRSNSLRDQLREMQLQHQSYQQAANYASTLDAYVLPSSSTTSLQAQQQPSSSGRGSFHSPTAIDQSPAAHVQPSPSNGNETVFPSLGIPSTPASSSTPLLGGTHSLQTPHNPYLEPSPSFNSADFSFNQPPSLDEIGSLFNEFLATESSFPSGGTPLKPVTEGEADP